MFWLNLLSSSNFKLIGAVILLIASFYSGYKYRDLLAEQEALERENLTLKETARAERELRQAEVVLQGFADTAGQNIHEQIKNIEERHSQLIELDSDVSPKSGGGVRDNASLSDAYRVPDNGKGHIQMPANPTATRRTSNACRCEQYRQVNNSLRKQLLNITKDCDITATKYNELLKLYQSIQTN